MPTRGAPDPAALPTALHAALQAALPAALSAAETGPPDRRRLVVVRLTAAQTCAKCGRALEVTASAYRDTLGPKNGPPRLERFYCGVCGYAVMSTMHGDT